MMVAGGASPLVRVVGTKWTLGLVSLLGAFEVLMAVSAGPLVTIGIGFVGGAMLMVAPWFAARSRRAALVYLVLGTVPFAALTWWSVVSPLLAVVALAIGVPAIRRTHRSAPFAEPRDVTPATTNARAADAAPAVNQ